MRTALPEFTATKLEPDYEARRVGLSYTVDGVFDASADVRGGLYWSSNDNYDHQDTKAADVPIDTSRGPHSAYVNLASLAPAPEGTSYLVFMIDPFDASSIGVGKVAEVVETDNALSIKAVSNPTVIFATSGIPYKNTDYGVSAFVTNNSLMEDEFQIHVSATPDESVFSLADGTPLAFTHTVVRGPADSGQVTVTIGALEQKEVFLQTVRDNWTWIPPSNPVTGSDTLKSAIQSGAEETTRKALQILQETIGKAVGWALLAKDFAKAVATTVPSQVTHGITYEVRAVSSFPSTLGRDVVPRTVSVPALRRAYLDDFLGAYRAGGLAWGQGVGMTVAGAAGLVFTAGGSSIAVAGGVGLMTYGLTRLSQARDAYEKAIDPPDPNYSTISEPSALQLALPSEVPSSGLLRRLVDAPAEAAAFERASTTARNRADGAQEARDTFWESEQLLAAARFSSQAALTYAELVELMSVAESLLGPLATGLPAETLPLIASQALPPIVTALLESFGFSLDQVEGARLVLASLSASDLANAGHLRDSAILAVANLSVAAMEELRDAVTLRVTLGGTVLVPTDEELLAMADGRHALEQRLSGHAPRGSLLRDIAAHIDAVRTAVLSTNNIDALGDRLTAAYDLLLSLQKTNPSIANVIDLVSSMQGAGSVTPELAAESQAKLNAAQEQLLSSEFSAAATSLSELINGIAQQVGTGMSADDAGLLIGQLAFLRDVFADGLLHPSAESTDDSFLVQPESVMLLDPLANDITATRLLALDGIPLGDARIDDRGTSDPADDRILYVAPSAFVRDTLRYVASNEAGDVVVGKVEILPLLPANVATTVVASLSDTHTLYFQGVAGDTYYLESFDDDYGSPESVLLEPTGSERYVSSYGSPFRLAQTGMHAIRWSSRGEPEDDLIVLRHLDAMSALDVTAPLQVDLDVAPDRDGATRMFVPLRGRVGDRFVLEAGLSGLDYPRMNLFSVGTEGWLDSRDLTLGAPNVIVFDHDATYYVEVYHYGSERGSIQLRLTAAATSIRDLHYGQAVEGAMSTPGERIVYRFEGTEGDRLLFDALGSQGWRSEWDIRDPRGASLFNDEGYLPSAGYDSGAFELPASGQYELWVTSDEGTVAPAPFRLLNIDGVANIELDEDLVVELNMQPTTVEGETHLFRLTVQEGTNLIAISDSLVSDRDPMASGVWSVINARSTDMSIYMDEVPLEKGFAAAIRQSGEVLLKIVTRNSSPGTFRFRLSATPEVTVQSMDLGQSVFGDISSPLEQRAYDVALAQGQLVLYEPGLSSGDRLLVRITAPSGKVVLFSSATQGEPFLAIETGTYRVSVAGQADSAKGTFEFRLVDLGEAATPVSVGKPAEVVLGANSSQALFVDQADGLRLILSALSDSTDGLSWSMYRGDGSRVSYGRGLSEPLLTSVGETLPLYAVIENRTQQPVSVQVSASSTSYIVHPLFFGQEAVGVVDTGGAVVDYHLEVSDGTLIWFDSLERDDETLTIALVDPLGEIAVNWSAGYDSEHPLRASLTGTYTVRLSGYEGRGGDYAFRLVNLSDAPLIELGVVTSGNTRGSDVTDSPTRETAPYRIAVANERLYEFQRIDGAPTFQAFRSDGAPVYWNTDFERNVSWLYVTGYPEGSQLVFVIDGANPGTSTPVDAPFAFTVVEEMLSLPVAHNDAAMVRSGGIVVIDVMGNDTLSGDGNRIEFVRWPSHGWMYIDDNGKDIVYMSSDGFVGQDTLSYLVRDRFGNVSGEAAVVINVRAPMPGDADGDGRVGLTDFAIVKATFGDLGNVPGDVNRDGIVDLADFGLLKQNFGRSESTLPGDVNADEVVDLSDFALVKNNFGRSGSGVVGDATGDNQVDLADFALLKENFGRVGFRSATRLGVAMRWSELVDGVFGGGRTVESPDWGSGFGRTP